MIARQFDDATEGIG